jgi:hypothetical protein
MWWEQYGGAIHRRMNETGIVENSAAKGVEYCEINEEKWEYMWRRER